MPDISTIADALEYCAPGTKSCDMCPVQKDCNGIANYAMAKAAKYLKEHMVRRLTPQEVIARHDDPIYLITYPPDIDTWVFYVAYIEHNGLFIFRDPDGHRCNMVHVQRTCYR